MRRKVPLKTRTGSAQRDLAVQDLLVPIAEFLQRSGMQQSQLHAEWQSAIRRASRARKGVKVIRIGYEQLGLTIVSRWLRDPNYLNHAGRPDDLPLRGKRSFSSLLKSCAVIRPAPDVLDSLLEFGTVKRIASNRFRLIRRSINFAIPNYLPFEPNFQFLVDALHASTWGSSVVPKSPRLFWQNVASSNVPDKYAVEFLRFAKERSLTFMHEINDWLEAHETVIAAVPRKTLESAKNKRLGIGLFGVCSDQ